MKVMYMWTENFDGGISSEYFENFEDCKADCINHVKNIRWTEKEMAVAKKNGENTVLIDKCYLDDDGYEVSFEDTGFSIEITEETVDRVY